jgi:hypothetical protein
MSRNQPWFGHRLFGAGLAPSSWQGWLSLLIYIVVLGWCVEALPGLIADPRLAGLARWAAPGLVTVAMLVLVWAKRDRSRPVGWRWGKR